MRGVGVMQSAMVSSDVHAMDDNFDDDFEKEMAAISLIAPTFSQQPPPLSSTAMDLCPLGIDDDAAVVLLSKELVVASPIDPVTTEQQLTACTADPLHTEGGGEVHIAVPTATCDELVGSPENQLAVSSCTEGPQPNCSTTDLPTPCPPHPLATIPANPASMLCTTADKNHIVACSSANQQVLVAAPQSVVSQQAHDAPSWGEIPVGLTQKPVNAPALTTISGTLSSMISGFLPQLSMNPAVSTMAVTTPTVVNSVVPAAEQTPNGIVPPQLVVSTVAGLITTTTGHTGVIVAPVPQEPQMTNSIITPELVLSRLASTALPQIAATTTTATVVVETLQQPDTTTLVNNDINLVVASCAAQAAQGTSTSVSNKALQAMMLAAADFPAVGAVTTAPLSADIHSTAPHLSTALCSHTTLAAAAVVPYFIALSGTQPSLQCAETEPVQPEAPLAVQGATTWAGCLEGADTADVAATGARSVAGATNYTFMPTDAVFSTASLAQGGKQPQTEECTIAPVETVPKIVFDIPIGAIHRLQNVLHSPAEKNLVMNMAIAMNSLPYDDTINHCKLYLLSRDNITMLDIMMTQYVLNGGILMKQVETDVSSGVHSEYTADLSSRI